MTGQDQRIQLAKTDYKYYNLSLWGFVLYTKKVVPDWCDETPRNRIWVLAPFVIHRLKVTPYGAWPAIGSRSCPRFSDIIDEFPSLNRHDYIFHNVNDNLNANLWDVLVIVARHRCLLLQRTLLKNRLFASLSVIVPFSLCKYRNNFA